MALLNDPVTPPTGAEVRRLLEAIWQRPGARHYSGNSCWVVVPATLLVSAYVVSCGERTPRGRYSKSWRKRRKGRLTPPPPLFKPRLARNWVPLRAEFTGR